MTVNVLLVSYFYPPSIGGLERQSHLLARSLVARGHRVRVIAARLEGFSQHEFLDGVEVSRISAGSGTRWQRMATFLIALVARAWSWAPWADVIQVQQALYPAAAMAVLGRMLGRRVVVRNAASGPFGAVHLMRSLPLGRFALSLTARLSIGVSLDPEMTAEMQSAGFRGIVEIPNGIEVVPATTAETRRVARERLRLSGRHVLFLGRLEAQKSVDVLLRAWTSVRTRDAILLIVGDGPAAAELRALAAELGPASGSVRFVGATADPTAYLSAADVLVLPSASEGLSNAILEAMVAGIPVVATDIAGNRQLIERPELGVLVPHGDAHALAGAIDRMLADTTAAEAMGRAAREHVITRYSVEAMTAAYARLYLALTDAGH